jgi:hypothetical protein
LRPYLKILKSKKGRRNDSNDRGQGPKFKPQYSQKTERQKERERE